MAVGLTHGAGVDGHQQTVMAWRVTPDPLGQPADGRMAGRAFGTLTRAWLALSDGVTEAGSTPVALESPGASGTPVDTRREGPCPVFLVNAAPVKPVPGRQTDRADARGRAKRRRDGCLPARVIPPRDQRERRDLTRYRTTLGQARTRELHRGPGGLERATSTLAAVATDLLGGAGRAIVAAWLEGRADPATMAEWAQGGWRRTRPVWEQALTGRVRDHHRRWLARPGAPRDVLEAQLEAWSTAMSRRLPDLRAAPTPLAPVAPAGAGAAGRASAWTGPDSSLPDARAVTGLDTSPGVDQRGGARWVAAWGSDMARVGTAARLAAWRGVAPGNAASAGKQRSGTTRQGHRARRTGLTPLAHAAALTQGTSVSAWSPRLAARRGKKRALRAVAPSIVVSAFARLSRHDPDHA